MKQNTITNSTLPIEVNYHALKLKGLELLKQLSGENWTNYNESDSGVTILDQLCYCLTELGYCTNFPIEDILTNEQGAIPFENQFYTPEEIFTTSPITPNDYRTLILDQLHTIEDIYITAGDDTVQKSVYAVYIHLKDIPFNQPPEIIIQNVRALLNKNRNIGELFSHPQALEPKKIVLRGTLELTANSTIDEIYTTINTALKEYVTPQIPTYGYNNLDKMGFSGGDIFNGPSMQSGWYYPESSLPEKRDIISLIDLSILINNVEGVISVHNLYFITNKGERTFEDISIGIHEIAQLEIGIDTTDIERPLTNNTLNTTLENELLEISSEVDVSVSSPTGDFREIEDYYSIQNTFPNCYGIGEGAEYETGSQLRVAQSRQLKGYLMAFDQILANEFSQLSHINELFSFNLSPRVEHKKTIEQKDYLTPYKIFEPVYYSQGLYNIPNVKPLLKGNDVFNYGLNVDNSPENTQRQWEKYKNDPYNLYIHDLKEIVENDKEGDSQRNAMMNHLLARHGEDSSLYDNIIKYPRWFGSLEKTKIIVKSLLLQNYGLLSYYRQHGYNIFHATSLSIPGQWSVTEKNINSIENGVLNSERYKKLLHCKNIRVDSEEEIYSLIQKECDLPSNVKSILKEHIPVTDHHADQSIHKQKTVEEINSYYNVNIDMLNDFSSFELLFDIVFGLTEYYQILRKTLLTILQSQNFATWENTKSEEIIQIHDDYTTIFLQYTDNTIRVACSDQKNVIQNNTIIQESSILFFSNVTRSSVRQTLKKAINQLKWFSEERKGFILLEELILIESSQLSYEEINNLDRSLSPYACKFIFPAYVNFLNIGLCSSSVKLLAQDKWPVNITNTYVTADCQSLDTLLPVYVDWFNTILDSPSFLVNKESSLSDKAKDLIRRLSTINEVLK